MERNCLFGQLSDLHETWCTVAPRWLVVIPGGSVFNKLLVQMGLLVCLHGIGGVATLEFVSLGLGLLDRTKISILLSIFSINTPRFWVSILRALRGKPDFGNQMVYFTKLYCKNTENRVIWLRPGLIYLSVYLYILLLTLFARTFLQF